MRCPAGPADVYLGLTGAVLGTIPTAAIYFGVYEWCKGRLEKRGWCAPGPSRAGGQPRCSSSTGWVLRRPPLIEVCSIVYLSAHAGSSDRDSAAKVIDCSVSASSEPRLVSRQDVCSDAPGIGIGGRVHVGAGPRAN